MMTKVSQAHVDLLKAIRRTQQNLATKVQFYHIHGHQDKHTSFHLLPRPAQLNVIVDRIAQQQFDFAHEHNKFLPNPIFNKEGWYLRIGGVKIMDRHEHHINTWISKKRLRENTYTIRGG